jgi:hypothetical protein
MRKAARASAVDGGDGARMAVAARYRLGGGFGRPNDTTQQPLPMRDKLLANGHEPVFNESPLISNRKLEVPFPPFS